MVHRIISCPHCEEMTIEMNEREGNIVVKRGFTGKKGPQWIPGHDLILTPICSSCGKKYKDEIEFDRKKRLGEFKKQGLPTEIEC